MTEWEHQDELEARWVREGVALDGETLLLVGREVMTNWARNDAHVQWNKPSADFIALDREGRLVVIELKTKITTPMEAARAACQVTAMALALGGSVTWPRLESAYAELNGGAIGGDLSTAWRGFVGRAALLAVTDYSPVRRILAAARIGPRAWGVWLEYEQATPAELLELLPVTDRKLRGRLAAAPSDVRVAPIEWLITA